MRSQGNAAQPVQRSSEIQRRDGHAGSIHRRLGAAAASFGRDARPAARSESPVSGLGRRAEPAAGGRPGALELPGEASARVAPLCGGAEGGRRELSLRACSICAFTTTLIGARAWQSAATGASPMSRCSTTTWRTLCGSRSFMRGTSPRPRNLPAQLLLGMSEHTAAAFRGMTLQLPAGAGRERNGEPDRALVHERRLLERAGARRVARGRSAAAQGPAVRPAARGRGAVAVSFGPRPAQPQPRRQVAARSLARFSLRGSYASPRPSPAHQDLQERHQGAQRHRSGGGGGRFLRAAGPERRRQDDAHRHHHLAGQQDRRQPSRCSATTSTASSRWPSPASAWCRRKSTSTCSRRCSPSW